MALNRPNRTLTTLALGIAILSTPQIDSQNSSRPLYAPTHQVSGVIRIWGSPQMGGLLHRYEEGFQKVQPSVRFENTLKSTITGVAGVYTGRADIALLGREIWPIEVQAFQSVIGHAPIAIEIATGAYDVPKATYALMILVNRANPIASLSTVQLDRIFGNTRQKPIRAWGDLGLRGVWARRNIHLYGFSTDNDKSLIFSRLIFTESTGWNCKLQEYANSIDDNAADAGDLIAQAVAKDPAGIGISNIHYATQAVKVLALSTRENESPVAPTRENIASRRYPLFRAVYMVIDRGDRYPGGSTALEFLHYVLSEQGLEDAGNEGTYLPLTLDIAKEQLRMLDAQ